MKKVLSLLALLSVLSILAPESQAAPPPHAGGAHGGHQITAGPNRGLHKPPHHGNMIMAGNHHRPHRGGNWGPPPPPPRGHYHQGGIILGGVLARRSYWNSPYYDYRLGWYDDYYPPYTPIRPYYGNRVYLNFGIPIRF